MRIILFICVSALVVSCSFENNSKSKIEQTNTYASLNDTLHIPFDSSRVIEMMDMQYSKELNDIESNLDTIRLRYTFYACDCPRWIRADQYDRDLNSPELAEYSYYIEAKTSEIELDERICSFTNEIILIGELRTKEGLPKNQAFTGPDPIKGNVFEYSSYESVFPMKVYGPPCHTQTTEIPGDKEELIMPTHLEIKLLPTKSKGH